MTITPMKARDGLEAVALLAPIIDEIAPKLALISDRSQVIRTKVLLQAMASVNGHADAVLSVVALGTGMSSQEVEKLSFPEALAALQLIAKANDWDTLWAVANSMRIIEDKTLAAWVWSRLGEIRLVG